MKSEAIFLPNILYRKGNQIVYIYEKLCILLWKQLTISQYHQHAICYFFDCIHLLQKQKSKMM